jgi:hypothetical protein
VLSAAHWLIAVLASRQNATTFDETGCRKMMCAFFQLYSECDAEFRKHLHGGKVGR